MPGRLRTTAPLIREKGPPPSSFCAASPIATTVTVALLMLAEREKTEAFPLSEHWEPSFLLLELELEGFSPNSVPSLRFCVLGRPESRPRDTGEKKGRNRKCSIVPVALCIPVSSPMLLIFQSPCILSWCYKQCSVEKQSNGLPLRYLEPTLHLFWECGFFFFGCAGSSLLYMSFLKLQSMGTALQLQCTGFSPWWLLLRWAGSVAAAAGSGAQAQELWCVSLVALQLVLSSWPRDLTSVPCRQGGLLTARPPGKPYLGLFVFFFLLYFTLQYSIGFAIH